MNISAAHALSIFWLVVCLGGGKNATLEKWEVRSIEHAVLNGVRMPVKSEATWKLKAGDFTWYKLEITDVEYHKPLLSSE
ncbi:DUF6920 family protein [Flavitalea antarctica]